MFYYILISVIAVILIAVTIVRKVNGKKNPEKIEVNSEEEELKDYDEDFFNATQNGEKSQLFISLASQKDCAIIRSLLQADGIPSYTEGEHMNNIYGGISGTMYTVVAIKIYILCKDYDRACEIIQDFTNQSGITVFNKENE